MLHPRRKFNCRISYSLWPQRWYCLSSCVGSIHCIIFYFIPCGVWEAVEIIEALLKNQSDIRPDTIHADTQGQSTVVFALAYLFGIKLMPRIRNWKDLKFFRPTKKSKYKHIDSLFSDTIDWELIETHWADLMQVVLSIKTGKMSSSLLLRKLSNYSRKNRLYRAFQELGHVIRTQFYWSTSRM
jgi:TnpA family transposase